MKDGLYTTEFWTKNILQVAALVLSLLVMTDVISADVSDELTATLMVLVPAVLELAYTISRTILKAQNRPVIQLVSSEEE